MRILMASPLRASDIGGSASYIGPLSRALTALGVSVSVVGYGRIERRLPPGLRHLVYAVRLSGRALNCDVILAFDTWSTGFPAFVVASVLRKKFAVRIGGDFLWESFVNRTKEEVRLSEFYTKERTLTAKERFIARGTRRLLHSADILFFTTRWQATLWKKAYGFAEEKVRILENHYPLREPGEAPRTKVIVAAHRAIPLKNMERFRKVIAFLQKRHADLALDERLLPHEEHIERVARAYAVAAPSFSEVCPNLILDGVRFGKPFLCTYDTGITERLAGAGLFVDTLDEKELLKALETLLDPERYIDLKRRVAGVSFTHSFADMARELYESL